jgi:MiaB/RimO family radical SAM methylthiotransferase
MRSDDASRQHGIFIVNASKRCEPSAFLFTRVVEFFLANNHGVAQDIDRCATILVNTCCVTEDKIESSLRALEKARAHGEGKRIVLCGCLASLPDSRVRRDDVICVGPKNLDRLDTLFPHEVSIRHILPHRLPPELYAPGQKQRGYADHFVMIAQGCSNRCSYCNISRAKGPVRSEPPEIVVSRIRQGLAAGAKEVTLLADDCASYGSDIGVDLVQLLERLLSLDESPKLKLGYMYPAFLLRRFDDLQPLFATEGIVSMNVPVQSGSQRVLDLMNRDYPIEGVLEAVDSLRSTAPGLWLSTHVIINFPTETREDFLRSLSVGERFDEVVYLHYSGNLGTAASRITPRVAPEEAALRLDMASDYVNRYKPGNGAVMVNFDCDVPYNVTRATPR